ncbi:L-histidine N(alpha)-methyltransferase [Fulvivirgaceae bacterium BMA10]|uniref:L-histidine N(Alpha)-methyltransferase n=1 Tax=Splendidivirga corallicola TaxID=3051826 RepID=A0ABT8KW62_9BACT|nr:L-histidine N(alpha)-methyltransferase [Fulvivirgaceae bacterium BMA10]
MNDTFAEDVLKGLSSTPKFLSSKYFYDEKGDELFQQIMNMPEYYLTRSEYEIFSLQKGQLLKLFQRNDQPFRLIEFGAGDGLKTKVLLEHFLEKKAVFKYTPIDISGNVLELLSNDLQQNYPSLSVDPMEGEYFQMLEKLSHTDSTRKIILFLGSNIGNFGEQEALKFLGQLSTKLNPQDSLLIGFDLKKDPEVVLNAYNDHSGITRAFNLNLLQRINNELDANFDLTRFKHAPFYDPMTGATKSYLVSMQKQDVMIASLGKMICFEQWEPIYMEVSQKYDLDMIKNLADSSGFKVDCNFFDCKHYFVDSLWSLKN